MRSTTFEYHHGQTRHFNRTELSILRLLHAYALMKLGLNDDNTLSWVPENTPGLAGKHNREALKNMEQEGLLQKACLDNNNDVCHAHGWSLTDKGFQTYTRAVDDMCHRKI